jgi:SAM-dependent methyltransferase
MEFLSAKDLEPSADLISLLANNAGTLGLLEPSLIQSCSPEKLANLAVGEYYWWLAEQLGRYSAAYLMKAQWGLGSQPEFFDHRVHFLDKENYLADHFMVSVANVLSVLPLNGRLLDLCSGDGYQDYHFYSKRASEVVAVDFDQEAHAQASRIHSRDNIRYHFASVMDIPLPPSYFDVVVIRGAIEHFTEEGQIALMDRVRKALKPGGWFCGDTPLNPNFSRGANQMLSHHEYEWRSEDEARQVLGAQFQTVHTKVLVSKDRTTVFWQCQ